MKKRALLNILHKKGIKLSSSLTDEPAENASFHILNESYRESPNRDEITGIKPESANRDDSQTVNEYQNPILTFTAPSITASFSSEDSSNGITGNHGNSTEVQVHMAEIKNTDIDHEPTNTAIAEENPDTIVEDAFECVTQLPDDENESDLSSISEIDEENTGDLENHQNILSTEINNETNVPQNMLTHHPAFRMTTKSNPLYDHNDSTENIFQSTIEQQTTTTSYLHKKQRNGALMEYPRNNGAYILPSSGGESNFYKHWSPTNATSYLDNEIMSIRSMMSRKTNRRIYSKQSDKTPTWVYTLFGALIWTFVVHCISAVEGNRATVKCSTNDHLRYWLCYFSLAIAVSVAEILLERRQREDIMLLLPFNMLVIAVIREVPFNCVFENEKTLYWVSAGVTFLIVVFIIVFWAIKRKRNK